MADFTVIRVGTDTSGRGIFMTRELWRVWQAVLAHPKVAPFADKVVIVQGAFMTRNGGGAAASAGFHDQAGCIDVRTWNLTKAQVDALIWVLRFEAGIAAWRRDKSWLHGGMDEHIHFTAGWDRPLSSGARDSWNQYLNNQNGLASRRVDYEKRPKPLVTKPKPTLFQEEDMAAADVKAIREDIARLRKDFNTFRQNEHQRDINIEERAKKRHSNTIAKIGGLADMLTELANDVADDATRQGVVRVKTALLGILAEDPAVDGPDNPAPAEEKE